MKSILTTLLASAFFSGFALADDCGGCKKGKEVKEEIVAGCDKCKKGEDGKQGENGKDAEGAEEEAILAGCDKCKKGKDGDKEEALLA